MTETHFPGDLIGQFEVVGQPLMGDMSIVYICFDRSRASIVALRTLKPEALARCEVYDCFMQKGAVWVDLGAHAHTVRCHEVFHPENTVEVYRVMDLLVWGKGREEASLRSWLTPGQPLPFLQVMLFALQIARGMQHVVDRIPTFVHGTSSRRTCS